MLASVLQPASSLFCCTPRKPDCCAIASTSRRLVGFYSAYDTTTASAAARGALSSGGSPIYLGLLRCLVAGAPAPPVHAHFAADLRRRGGSLRTIVETAAAPAPPRAARRDGRY